MVTLLHNNVRVKGGLYQELFHTGATWLDENLKGQWHFYGNSGAIFINFQTQEDKCLFILKYGDFIA